VLPREVRGKVGGGDPDGVADPGVRELAAVAQAVHRVRMPDADFESEGREFDSPGALSLLK
jgi:hypothetical protein